MLNVFVDKGVKNVELFRQLLESSSLMINTFSNLNECEPHQVDVAIIWLTRPKCLSEFKNLKLLLISGSGIDHIINSISSPHSVPTIRLVDYKLRNKVADYVIEAVEYYKSLIKESDNTKITVGLLGLGLIGCQSAEKLQKMGYNVVAWVKSPNKKRSISKVYFDVDGLVTFAKQSQVVVCQLPLTESTRYILNKNLFDLMPKDSYVVNVGRGWHLNEEHLINAIKNDHLLGACLDVSKIEPIPENHALRYQSKIKLTPHIAGGIFPNEQAKYALKVIYNFFNGKEHEGLVNFDKKY